LAVFKKIIARMCETPAGAACQPPEYSSRKACDEEAHFGMVFVYTQEQYFIYLTPGLTARPAESEPQRAEINLIQKQQFL
jgi:hypothetical protein